MSAENPEYWGFEDEERLTCTTIEERVQMFCEECDGPLPETIELVGYDCMKVNADGYDDYIIEYLLERLDDDYGDPEDAYTNPTENMKAAAKEFVEKVVAEYDVFRCKIVCKKTVRISDYLSDAEAEE